MSAAEYPFDNVVWKDTTILSKMIGNLFYFPDRWRSIDTISEYDSFSWRLNPIDIYIYWIYELSSKKIIGLEIDHESV